MGRKSGPSFKGLKDDRPWGRLLSVPKLVDDRPWGRRYLDAGAVSHDGMDAVRSFQNIFL